MDNQFQQADVAPNETIYINNLNEKVKKSQLKKGLYAIFSQFGKVLDIVAIKTMPLKGQAWVVFEDVNSATNALRKMQGFPMYEQPMRIQFAVTKSHAVLKKEGKYIPLRKRKEMEGESGEGDAKRVATEPSGPKVSVPLPPPRTDTAPPNKMLLAQNLPESVTQESITEMFKPYAGFVSARVVTARGIALIDFENEMQATIALQGLNNTKLTPTHSLFLTYAKK